MGVVFDRVTKQSITVEVDDTLKPYLGIGSSKDWRMDEITINLSDWAFHGTDYFREEDSWDAGEGPCHRREDRAEHRLSILPRPTPLLGVCVADKNKGGAYPYSNQEVWAQLKKGCWSDHCNHSEFRTPIGFLRPNYQKRTRRKYILTYETGDIGSQGRNGGPMVTGLVFTRLVFTHGPLTEDCGPVVQYRWYEEGHPQFEKYAPSYGYDPDKSSTSNFFAADETTVAPVGPLPHVLIGDDRTEEEIENWSSSDYEKNNGYYLHRKSHEEYAAAQV